MLKYWGNSTTKATKYAENHSQNFVLEHNAVAEVIYLILTLFPFLVPCMNIRPCMYTLLGIVE